MRILRIIKDDRFTKLRFCISKEINRLGGFKTPEEAEEFIIKFLPNIKFESYEPYEED